MTSTEPLALAVYTYSEARRTFEVNATARGHIVLVQVAGLVINVRREGRSLSTSPNRKSESENESEGKEKGEGEGTLSR
jgi:hypothetical protein